MNEYRITDYLLKSSPEFIKLFELHKECKQKLANLNQKSNISPEDVLSIKVLKKKKLQLKDTMQKMILDYEKKKAVPID